MSEKYALSRRVWILAAVVIGLVVLGSYLVQTHQLLKAVEIELGRAKEETVRAKTWAAELAKVAEDRSLELNAANTERQALQSQVKNLKQVADQAKAEATERDSQIAKLRQGTADCEEFFNAWEVRGAPASISAIAALGREAAAAKDCIDKGDVATACKHWQGLLVQIGKMGPPLSESRGDIEELMRQKRCKAKGNPN
jgi:hypothetical protein